MTPRRRIWRWRAAMIWTPAALRFRLFGKQRRKFVDRYDRSVDQRPIRAGNRAALPSGGPRNGGQDISRLDRRRSGSAGGCRGATRGDSATPTQIRRERRRHSRPCTCRRRRAGKADRLRSRHGDARGAGGRALPRGGSAGQQLSEKRAGVSESLAADVERVDRAPQHGRRRVRRFAGSRGRRPWGSGSDQRRW